MPLSAGMSNRHVVIEQQREPRLVPCRRQSTKYGRILTESRRVKARWAFSQWGNGATRRAGRGEVSETESKNETSGEGGIRTRGRR